MVVEQQLQQQEIRSSCSGRTVTAITAAVSKIAFAVTAVTAAERSEQVKAQQQTAGLLQWWIDDAFPSAGRTVGDTPESMFDNAYECKKGSRRRQRKRAIT